MCGSYKALNVSVVVVIYGLFLIRRQGYFICIVLCGIAKLQVTLLMF